MLGMRRIKRSRRKGRAWGRVDVGGDGEEVLLLLRHVSALVAVVAPSPIEHICPGIYPARYTCTGSR